MVDNSLSIKDFFINYNDEFTPKYGLEVWFNSLLKKRIGELDVNDICTMLRQDILIEEIALDKAIEFIRQNPLAGNMFDGEILEMINRIPLEKYLSKEQLIRDLISILVDIKDNLIRLDWICEDDMKRYSSILSSMLCKLENV
ncbi:hypothetical protein Ga0466249_005219 [Sporomusaceae bacterium BoRhaA]|uniref:contact-dependent growth inhibition system immunity protein n=1 Tax=Pelorhabdus rhamnosifermentans TaxID=2772457 RepID=UPI001C05FAB8|nr:contact-dependent growth inhibition system immunity protein [Pelorhabdus rhamnosifermentans]MBU2704067.1 hypothetical protein [Pelorhabdus rhamnosifermentans]